MLDADNNRLLTKYGNRLQRSGDKPIRRRTVGCWTGSSRKTASKPAVVLETNAIRILLAEALSSDGFCFRAVSAAGGAIERALVHQMERPVPNPRANREIVSSP
jgi:hypothetical protein